MAQGNLQERQAKPKKVATHPKYSEMVQAAITSLKERGGSSRQAILKYIMKNYKVGTDEKPVNTHLKMALRSGVKSGGLKQSTGTGASGRLKVGEVKKVEKKPKKKVNDLNREVATLRAIATKYPLSGVKWVKVEAYDDFKKGQHIAYTRELLDYWHHAIIEEVNTNPSSLSIILWDLDKKEIVKRQFQVRFTDSFWQKIERAVYTKGCYDDELVIQRAQSRVGEKDYGFFTNFARAFPEWCKTGQGRLTHDDKRADSAYLRYVEEN